MADVTLSQEDLDNRIAAAIQQATTDTEARFADYTTLQTAAQRLAELERTNEDAVQRQIREAKEQAQAEVPNLVAQATEDARRTVVEAEIRAWAAQYNFSYPEDVVAKLRDDGKIKVDGKFKVTGVEDLVKGLAASRPEWLKRQFNGAPPRGSNGSTVDMTDQERTAYIQRVATQRRQAIGAVI